MHVGAAWVERRRGWCVGAGGGRREAVRGGRRGEERGWGWWGMPAWHAGADAVLGMSGAQANASASSSHTNASWKHSRIAMLPCCRPVSHRQTRSAYRNPFAPPMFRIANASSNDARHSPTHDGSKTAETGLSKVASLKNFSRARARDFLLEDLTGRVDRQLLTGNC